MNYSLLLPELIVAVLGLLLLSVDLYAREKRVLAAIGVVGTVLALIASFSLFGQEAEIWNGTIRVDDFAAFFKVIFLVVLGLVFLFSGEYLEKREMKVGEFYVLVTFATLGAMLLASSLNLITLYLSLELLALASYALTGMLKQDLRSSEASLKFFLVGALTSGVILYGLSLLYGLSGSVHLLDVRAAVAQSANPALVAVAGVLVIAGFGFKVAAVPFHLWAPDAYEGAPTPVAAFLITTSEAAGFAALLRLLLVGLAPVAAQWQLAVAVLAAVTMTYGNITAIVQTRTKRMLAYSAIAQAGYVLVGVAVASQAGVSALMYYLLVYAFMTVGAFTVVTMLSNHVPSEEIEDFKGLSQRSPAFAIAMSLLLLSLIGIPPMAGFFGKFALFRAAVDGGLLWLALVMTVNSAISVPYYFGIIRNMFLKETDDAAPLSTRLGVKVALGVSVAGIFLLGIFPEPVVRFLTSAHLLP